MRSRDDFTEREGEIFLFGNYQSFTDGSKREGMILSESYRISPRADPARHEEVRKGESRKPLVFQLHTTLL